MIATIMITAMIQASTYRHPAFCETLDRNPASATMLAAYPDCQRAGRSPTARILDIPLES